jgi:hypothetical protein
MPGLPGVSGNWVGPTYDTSITGITPPTFLQPSRATNDHVWLYARCGSETTGGTYGLWSDIYEHAGGAVTLSTPVADTTGSPAATRYDSGNLYSKWNWENAVPANTTIEVWAAEGIYSGGAPYPPGSSWTQINGPTALTAGATSHTYGTGVSVPASWPSGWTHCALIAMLRCSSPVMASAWGDIGLGTAPTVVLSPPYYLGSAGSEGNWSLYVQFAPDPNFPRYLHVQYAFQTSGSAWQDGSGLFPGGSFISIPVGATTANIPASVNVGTRDIRAQFWSTDGLQYGAWQNAAWNVYSNHTGG